MTIYTKENAQKEYSKNISNLDKNLKGWTKEEIKEFKKNGRKEIENMYLTALDYNSLIIVLKYLIKKSWKALFSIYAKTCLKNKYNFFKKYVDKKGIIVYN